MDLSRMNNLSKGLEIMTTLKQEQERARDYLKESNYMLTPALLIRVNTLVAQAFKAGADEESRKYQGAIIRNLEYNKEGVIKIEVEPDEFGLDVSVFLKATTPLDNPQRPSTEVKREAK